jgi:hypothetical protein
VGENTHAARARKLGASADAVLFACSYRLPRWRIADANEEQREEAKVAIAMLMDNPEGSKELYDRIRKQLDLEAPAGGILHVAGPSPNGGWRVVEVFESEEDAGRFLKERFGPALEAVGFAGRRPQPQFWPVHNYMK